MTAPVAIWLSGREVIGQADSYPLLSPQTQEHIAVVSQASREELADAIVAMADVMPMARQLGSHVRCGWCRSIYEQLGQRADEFARCITLESGKPLKLAEAEVARALTTFRLAMEESTRLAGVQLPADAEMKFAGYHAVAQRVPVGPCLFITPFNFPLNLVAHKVAPALACGCPFIVKPSERTPMTAHLLGELLCGAKLPAGYWHILPCRREDLDVPLADDRICLMSFTGSAPVGWKLKAQAGKKRVLLELGNNSAVVVEPEVNLRDAVERIVPAAFGFAGQSCISVQRIFLHESIAMQASRMLVEKTRQLKLRDTLVDTDVVGPMIDRAAAIRVEEWVNDAVRRGAALLCGGRREDSFYHPTLLTNVAPESPLISQEVFGPVAEIETYHDFEDALNRVNQTPFGLQAGVFTDSLAKARRAFEVLDMGTIIINDVPTTRIDALPYGGVKDSGLGREGGRFAIEHFTEYKVFLERMIK
ncbi:MAG: aldehyde dehydrogenase family protein [Phycisphaerae bacterium]|nr:aldehyde dehydrogenase family protein [Phycisphaerae bacterium]